MYRRQLYRQLLEEIEPLMTMGRFQMTYEHIHELLSYICRKGGFVTIFTRRRRHGFRSILLAATIFYHDSFPRPLVNEKYKHCLFATPPLYIVRRANIPLDIAFVESISMLPLIHSRRFLEAAECMRIKYPQYLAEFRYR